MREALSDDPNDDFDSNKNQRTKEGEILVPEEATQERDSRHFVELDPDLMNSFGRFRHQRHYSHSF